MIAITETKRSELTKSDAPAQRQLIDSSVDEAVRRRIAACPYRFVFDKITWHVDGEALRLCGCVPSFYLKQVLQELLRDIEAIDHIANELQVVSSTGLSSDRINESP